MDYYLQQLKQGLVMPDSYEEWREYRNRVTDFILTHQNNDTLVILGAGPSNDMDLGKLCLHYKEIYLADNRKEALQEALCTYQIEHDSKIKLIVSDFWKFPDMALEGLEECLQQKEQVTFLYEYLEKMQKWAYENTVYPKIGKDAQVVVFGVHSQFNSCVASLLGYYKNYYMEEELESLYDLLRKWNEIAVGRFHEYLFSEFSSVYLGYEYAVYEEESDYLRLKEVVSLFMKGEGKMARKISVTRVDGAYEAEKDLCRLIGEDKVEIVSMQYDVWNFTKYKGYFMCLYFLER